ncbi:MAG: type I glyceraldehyde-3-phosphate dehydrogenase [Deltaproteobacteria bacterium]|nr:type I glyceraldehyde-3-phosphate dehydrogenase [Deltaproteobacteria bacterium]
MATKIAINGFGRIGRCIVRAMMERKDSDLELVAINDLTDPKTLAHLLKHDSVHRRAPFEVGVVEDGLMIGGKKVRVTAEKDPAKLPWKELGVPLVLECTGRFRDQAGCKKHIEAGAKKVIISAPGEKDVDATFCVGINADQYDPAKHHIVSNASCTTNCLAPVAKVIDETFGIVKGQMTTVHSYTNDQMVLDLPHKDLRRARAAAQSMIPTSTGAAKAIGLVLPRLVGKLDGFAIRVPTPDVSIVCLVVEVEKKTDKAAVNAALEAAAKGPLAGVLYFSKEELVSSDFIGDPHSSTVDSKLTQVIGENLVSVQSWYDNEMGFSHRMVDLAKLMAAKL